MISDVLLRLAVLHREIPEDEFDVDDAVEVAAEDVDRELSDDEWSQLNEMLPEWLEQDEASEVGA